MIHDVGSQIVTCHPAELTFPPCSGKSHTAQLMPLPLTVSCFSKIRIGFTFLVSAHPGSPAQRAVKRACVCVCVWSRSGCVRRVVASATVASVAVTRARRRPESSSTSHALTDTTTSTPTSRGRPSYSLRAVAW